MWKDCLNGLWRAKLDPENVGMAQNWAQNALTTKYEVRVPGCIQQLDALAEEYPPTAGMRNGYQGTWFAETTLTVSKLGKQHVFLRLEGANPACHLFVNGHYVSHHTHVICPWESDVTAFVVEGENRVTVAITEDYHQLYAGSRFCGVAWSGIFGSVYAEISSAVRLSDLCLTEQGVSGMVTNHGGEDFAGDIHAQVLDVSGTIAVSVAAGEAQDFILPMDTAALPRWWDTDPTLLSVRLSCNQDEVVLRTGLRTFTTKGERIVLNGSPVFLAGAGEEFESLEVSPMTNRALIRARFKALKEHGFNFYRYHTHVPTEEELSVADEMGIMVDAEMGLVTNFHKMAPVERAFEMLSAYVRATRNHPALVVYCLGNEGSQLMVEIETERNKARIGYDLIKKNTQNQLAMTCFGNQGELPELENDIETPHLWSDTFLAAYDGLSRVPWDVLANTTLNRPCVIHEYGKFGVWPDMREEEAIHSLNGVKKDFASQARLSLTEKGVSHLEELFLRNSRKLNLLCTKIILEEARRQPYVSGYALWSFFRGCNRNTGICDDMGVLYDGSPAAFAEGCNGKVALMMDRGFQQRAIPCYVPQQIDITLSNFSRQTVAGQLCVMLMCGETVISENTVAALGVPGSTGVAMRFVCSVPGEYHGKKLTLAARLNDAHNEWDFWAFSPAASDARPLFHIENASLLASLREVFPGASTLLDADSVITGCRAWKYPQMVQTALALRRPVIADVWDEVTRQLVKAGVRVLLLDSGKFPETWYNPAIFPQLGERDTGRYFTSFRAGWHMGNLLTVIQPEAMPTDFPHEGYCDLHFYNMVQSARGLHRKAIAEQMESKVEAVIYAVAKIPFKAPALPTVQDPNAIKEQKIGGDRTFDWMEQGYLCMADNLTVCALRLTADVAGRTLLKQLVQAMQNASH